MNSLPPFFSKLAILPPPKPTPSAGLPLSLCGIFFGGVRDGEAGALGSRCFDGWCRKLKNEQAGGRKAINRAGPEPPLFRRFVP
jgi:hypothetical protein